MEWGPGGQTLSHCIRPYTSFSSVLNFHFPLQVHTVYSAPFIWCQTSPQNIVNKASEWWNDKKKFLKKSTHTLYLQQRPTFFFMYIYSKLCYLAMKYFPPLVNSSKIHQMSKERETGEILNVPLPDAWNDTEAKVD